MVMETDIRSLIEKVDHLTQHYGIIEEFVCSKFDDFVTFCAKKKDGCCCCRHGLDSFSSSSSTAVAELLKTSAGESKKRHPGGLMSPSSSSFPPPPSKKKKKSRSLKEKGTGSSLSSDPSITTTTTRKGKEENEEEVMIISSTSTTSTANPSQVPPGVGGIVDNAWDMYLANASSNFHCSGGVVEVVQETPPPPSSLLQSLLNIGRPELDPTPGLVLIPPDTQEATATTRPNTTHHVALYEGYRYIFHSTLKTQEGGHVFRCNLRQSVGGLMKRCGARIYLSHDFHRVLKPGKTSHFHPPTTTTTKLEEQEGEEVDPLALCDTIIDENDTPLDLGEGFEEEEREMEEEDLRKMTMVVGIVEDGESHPLPLLLKVLRSQRGKPMFAHEGFNYSAPRSRGRVWACCYARSKQCPARLVLKEARVLNGLSSDVEVIGVGGGGHNHDRMRIR